MRCDFFSRQKKQITPSCGAPKSLKLSPIWIDPTLKLLCSSYLETWPTMSPSLQWNPSTAGPREWLFSCRKYSSLLLSCVQLCISLRYVLSFVRSSVVLARLEILYHGSHHLTQCLRCLFSIPCPRHQSRRDKRW